MVFPPSCMSWKAVRASSPLPVVPWPSPSPRSEARDIRPGATVEVSNPWAPSQIIHLNGIFSIPVSIQKWGYPHKNGNPNVWNARNPISRCSCRLRKVFRSQFFDRNQAIAGVVFLLLGDCSFVFINVLSAWKVTRPPWSLKDSDRPPDWVQHLAVNIFSWHWATASDSNLKLSPLSEAAMSERSLNSFYAVWIRSFQDVMAVQFLPPNAWAWYGLIFWSSTLGKSDPKSLIPVLECSIVLFKKHCRKLCFFEMIKPRSQNRWSNGRWICWFYACLFLALASGSCISASLPRFLGERQIGDGMSWALSTVVLDDQTMAMAGVWPKYCNSGTKWGTI